MDKKEVWNSIKGPVTLITVLVVLFVMKVSGRVAVTLTLAFFLYLILSPLASRLEKLKIPATLATIITMLVLILLIAGALLFFFYSVNLLITTLPKYAGRYSQIEDMVRPIVGRFIDVDEEASLLSAFNIDWINLLMNALRRAASTSISLISNGLVVCLLVAFLLAERNTIIPKAKLLAKNTSEQQVEHILTKIIRQISKYIGIKTFISAMTGLCFYFTGAAVKMEFSLIFGVLAFIMNFIPTIGSIIITALAILVAVLQFFPVWPPIIFVAVCTITIQMVFGNILDPKMQGNQLNLSPFVLLVSLSVWGYILGIVGLFLAVPMMSIIEIILANFESTRPLSILLSNGKLPKERKLKRRTKKGKDEDPVLESLVMPDSEAQEKD